MNYFYAINGQQNGPVPEEQLATLASNGIITSETLIWREGMADWVPYGTVFGTAAGVAAVPPLQGSVVCSVCHQTFPADQTIQYGTVYVCGGCKPKFVQGLREGAVSSTSLEYASIGARFGAKILDSIILAVLQWSLILATSSRNDPAWALIIQLVSLSLGILYQVIFLGSKGQTPGKMALGIKVVNPDGTKISYGKATGRAFAEILSGCLLSIGYLIAIWDDEKRTLHDRLAGTRVVKVQR